MSFPIHNLTADKLKECYEKTMFTLRSVSLNVVGISVDNAAVNRNFYALICEGNLQTHVMYPVTGQPIFLFFDPVHNIKNIYIIFRTEKYSSALSCRNIFRMAAFQISIKNAIK